MPIADWSVPFSLTSTVYDANPLPINELIPGFGIYILRPDGCSLRTSVRSTKEDIPQADGSILHTRYLTGMEMTLAVQLWENEELPACNEVAQEMLDTFMGYMYGLLNAGDNEGRIVWTPDGENDRMLDDIRLFSYPEESLTDGGILELTTTIDTRFPYSMDETELQVTLDASEVVLNAGNRPTYPVFKISGPFTGFTMVNTTTGQQMVYDGTRLGAAAVAAGDFIEFDMLRNTAYLGTYPGAGDQDNMKPGIDPINSEFFPLAVGPNTITLTRTEGGAIGGFALVNAAWA